MGDFLSDTNIYGQNILQLVSRGNAIIAELLRLKDYIPEVFRLQKKQDVQKYGEIIFDFSYFKTAEAYEKKIESNEVLRDLDEQFRDNHIKMISRFYLIFESIYTYIADFNQSLNELEEGLFMQQTLESVFANAEGKQLMCEVLYLYGIMLLLLDAYIEGAVRERLLVSYYRYTPQRRDGKYAIDEICKLMRDTGYNSLKKPNNYPEDFFKRIPIKPSYVDMVIGRLHSDDIYNQLSVYTLSKHRTAALSTQASMLFVCLYFSPDILHNQTALMREIVDKYFPDNWVISIYMGFTMNVVECWENFKAARLAISNTITNQNIKSHSNLHNASVANLLKTAIHYLKEGNITREKIMDDINTVINTLKDCNVTIRWLMLHTLRAEKNKKYKQLQDCILSELKIEPVLLFKLLLNTAQLEVMVKDMIKNMLEEKSTKWESFKKENCESLLELADVFGGVKYLSRIQKNANLQKWFVEISKQIDSLSQDSSGSGKKIIQLIQALEDVQEFHQLEKNMHIVQCLSEIRKNLHQMLQTLNIKENVLITLQIIADFSYGWNLIDSYTSVMQEGIKREPTLCIKLRAIFMKLASALETPLIRINQAQSKDLISVSQYYSSELEIYIRKVLQIIPKMMFQKLLRIIEIQTSILKELPTKLDKEKMKDYAQLDERFEFAELTNSISVYSQGICMMKSTLVGVICLDPKKLLEDGIRKELVLHISEALHFGLVFSQKKGELESRIAQLANVMNGYKRSFEYIQDYVNINGLKIWQEEITRIINYNVEQECNVFSRNKLYAWESKHQNKYVPIPHFLPTDNLSENFIGCLAKEILRLTDPRSTVFVSQNSTWYDLKTHKDVFNKETIKSIAAAVEIIGLVGLDRLFSFMIVFNLEKIIAILDGKEFKDESWNGIISIIARSGSTTNIIKFHQSCINKTTKPWSNVLAHVLTVGQLQLLRKLIAFYLNISCQFNAKNLEISLRSLNKVLIETMSKEIEPQPSEEVLLTLSKYLDYCGMNDPINKIYVTSKYKEDYAALLFAFVLVHLQKLIFIKNAGNSAKKIQDKFDGTVFVVGLHTTIKQFPQDLNNKFIQYLSNFATELFSQNIGQRSSETPTDILLVLKFLETYSGFSKSSENTFKKNLPEELVYLLDTFCTVSQ